MKILVFLWKWILRVILELKNIYKYLWILKNKKVIEVKMKKKIGEKGGRD